MGNSTQFSIPFFNTPNVHTGSTDLMTPCDSADRREAPKVKLAQGPSGDLQDH